MTKHQQIWAVVPAAGIGARMQADRPKQYLHLLGKSVIEHALSRFLNHQIINGVVVAIADNDDYWSGLDLLSSRLFVAPGGSERCHSVLSALQLLSTMAQDDDWVLVHDAARPCLRSEDIDHLINTLCDDSVGGLLALPVRDTMKRADDQSRVVETVERDGLWHALTPQMFRLGLLRKAMEQTLANGEMVTDEAMAIEMLNLKPRLVEGHADNIKITHPQDLALAELYIQQQENS